MSAFENALKVVNKTLERSAGETVTYKRGATEKQIKAVPTASMFEEVDEVGHVREQTKYMDWLTDPETEIIGETDNTFDTEFGDPQPKDVVERTIGGVTETFLVEGPLGQAAWRFTDAHETMLRVHSLRVA